LKKILLTDILNVVNFMEDKNSRKYGYKLGLKDGFKQGIIQGKKICADEMLKLGIDIKVIKKVTKLSIEEIKKDYNQDY